MRSPRQNARRPQSRPLRRDATRVLAALALVVWGAAALRAAVCRRALALALDVSGSVDAREYAMQRRGLAAALSHPQVQEALFSSPTPVEILVYEWSGPGAQRVILPWTALTSPDALAAATRQITEGARVALPPSTALGEAMRYGFAALATRSCARLTLDISGDGKSNEGPRPGPLRHEAESAGITVNALVIGAGAPIGGTVPRHNPLGGSLGNSLSPPNRDTGGTDGAGATAPLSSARAEDLTAYFRANVIAGSGAFTESALGFSDYEAAMVRKLLRELSTMTLSQL